MSGRRRQGLPDAPADELEAEDALPWEDDEPSKADAREEARLLQQRQEQFRAAARRIAAAFAEIPSVERIVLFGSVAVPLPMEVPRFREFRRAGIELPHECRDIDLAVWLDDLDDIRRLSKARSRALNALLVEAGIGVAHHQVDVFLFEPGTERYLGRLCLFNKCPKGKRECLVPRCGEAPFLQRIEGFEFRPDALNPGRIMVLFER